MLLAAGVAVACSAPANPESAITAERILSHVTALAADQMEGRAPGTAGEERAVAYLAQEFKRIGLKAGPDGTFTQRVPLIGFRGLATGSVQVTGRRTPLRIPEDAIAVSRQGLPDVAVNNSDIVFVGYGVVAPELAWDDFKGVDVRGKTIVMLVGDPPVPDSRNPAVLDPAVFNGPAMTYYGRWTYKYEVA
ncbi:MAG: peptidase M28, partial [Vicinamibacterales bacterium]